MSARPARVPDPREAALEQHRSPQILPDDFADFWRDSVAEARGLAWEPRAEPVETPLRTIDVFDVTFAGFGGQPIHAWLRLPAHRTGPLPVVIHFTGYGAGRGRAIDDLTWASAGFAHLVMDTRGQGDGSTPDGGFGDSTGYLTRGLADPAEHYYRRVFVDAALLVDAARRLPSIDPGRVALIGNSQGGAIALAAACLSERVAGVFAQSPFLADIPTALTLSGRYPFQELTDLFARDHARRDAALATLRYVDVVNFARLARTPAWLSCGLNDDIAPAATAYAVRNAYAAEAHLTVWPANGHDAGGADDRLGALAVLAELFATD